VPHALADLKLDARITAGTVELLHHGRRVAGRACNDRAGSYTTVVEDVPAAHRAHLEWAPQRRFIGDSRSARLRTADVNMV
jgi:hypothetical protein